jgi:hypothetical protein
MQLLQSTDEDEAPNPQHKQLLHRAVTLNRNCSTLCSLYAVYMKHEGLTALNVMAIVSKMRRRVVWQAHNI